MDKMEAAMKQTVANKELVEADKKFAEKELNVCCLYKSANVYTNVCACMHTHVHVYACTHIHTRTHAYTCLLIRMYFRKH